VVNENPVVKANAVLSLTQLANHSKSSAKQILCSKNRLSELLNRVAKENVRIDFLIRKFMGRRGKREDVSLIRAFLLLRIFEVKEFNLFYCLKQL